MTMSDAELVARLHAAAEEERLSRHGSGALEDEAADAIERLTRDLTECQNAALQSGLYGMAECKRLEAERERLSAKLDEYDFMREELNEARADIRNFEAERDRLAEELEAVRGMRPSEYRDHYRELYERQKEVGADAEATVGRLRAALQRIDGLAPEDGGNYMERVAYRMGEIAREALRSPPGIGG